MTDPQLMTNRSIPLNALLAGLAGSDAIHAHRNQTIRGLSLDSRELQKGQLFCAIPGNQQDGRGYIDAALSVGATVLYDSIDAPESCKRLEADGQGIGIPDLRQEISEIAARFFGRPSADMKVTGITGTNGKTTCAWLLTQALEQLGEHCMIMGTIGAGPLQALEPARLTTADAINVQRALSQWLAEGATAVCMEVSSHGLEQDRVKAVQFAVAVFTNLSQDHLDYHQTMEDYGAAKKKLFSFDSLQAMVVNVDDALGQEIIASAHSKRVITYGLSNADITPTEVVCDSSGIQFELAFQGSAVQISSTLLGEINLPNLLAVIATVLAYGHKLETIAAIVPNLTPPPGRMEPIARQPGKPAVVIDYSHTPDSLARALQSLRPLCQGDLWVVFGCGGDRDQGKRALMGQAAANLADHVIVTNDNPRSEDPQVIADAVVAGIESVSRAVGFQIILDRQNAIATAIKLAQPEDMVLVAGKGHETTQTVADCVILFNDREVVAELMGVSG